MDALFTRADREIAVEDFGKPRVMEGIAKLFRAEGLSILTADALNEVLAGLQEDDALHQRLNRQNRELHAPGVTP